MSALELIFDTKVVPLELGEPLAIVEQKLAGLPHEVRDPDAELRRRYVTMQELGVSFMFSGDDKLDTIFIYVESRRSGNAPFKGRISLLPDDFFQYPDKNRFIQALQEKNFSVWPVAYPAAVNMVSSDMRVGLRDSPHTFHITIDDGSMLRKKVH